MTYTYRRLGKAVAVVALQAMLAPVVSAATAKNIIICISDGCGYNTFNAASYYQYGRVGHQPYEQPEWVKLSSRTISQNQLKSNSRSTRREKNNGTEPASVWDPQVDAAAAMSIAGGIPFKGYALLKKDPTDSAAAATAMAMGSKVLNGRINYLGDGSRGNEKPAAKGKTIPEIAKSMGKSAGVITTVQWNDATPAALGGAHSVARTSRHDLANEMFTNGTLDVIMGAGHPEYDANGAPRQPVNESDYDIVGGSFTWDLIKSGRHSSGWKLIETKAQFEALMAGSTPSRVFGLARVPGTLQQERQTRDWNDDGKVDAADVRIAPPFKDPFLTTVPTLVTMTKGALNVLSHNPNGFYLMVEGGAVDHAAHSNQPGRLIEEQVEFNNSVQAVIDWVNRYSNWDETLVIVTADHETGLIWGSNSDMIAFERLINRGSERMPRLWFNSNNHSISLVPLRARGAGASSLANRIAGNDPVYGQYVENTTIFEVMKAAFKGTELKKSSRGSAEAVDSTESESGSTPTSEEQPVDSMDDTDSSSDTKTNGD